MLIFHTQLMHAIFIKNPRLYKRRIAILDNAFVVNDDALKMVLDNKSNQLRNGYHPIIFSLYQNSIYLGLLSALYDFMHTEHSWKDPMNTINRLQFGHLVSSDFSTKEEFLKKAEPKHVIKYVSKMGSEFPYILMFVTSAETIYAGQINQDFELFHQCFLGNIPPQNGRIILVGNRKDEAQLLELLP